MTLSIIEQPRRNWVFKIKFEPRDIWVGAFWTIWKPSFSFAPELLGDYSRRPEFRLYICLVPCLPIMITRRFGTSPMEDLSHWVNYELPKVPALKRKSWQMRRRRGVRHI